MVFTQKESIVSRSNHTLLAILSHVGNILPPLNQKVPP